MISIFRKHKKIFLTAAIAITGVFIVILPAHAQTSFVWDSLSAGAIKVVGLIVGVWVRVLGQLAVQLVKLVLYIASYNGFVTSAAVENGWVIIRDVVNMFFILILLVIAFATIFNVKEYRYQAMLPRLLIMAVVINFSRTICGIMIDFGQVVMLTFVNGFQAAAGGNFMKALKIEELMNFREGTEAKDFSQANVFAAFVLAAIMVTITVVVLGAMALMLAMRIIILWFLVILSPIAFLTSVWPSGRIKQKYAMWWDMFLDNIMVGPIMAFFLWLSLLVLGNGDVGGQIKTESTYKEAAGEKQTEMNVGISQIGTTDNMLSYLIGVGMLLGTLVMTQSMRSAGGGIASAALGKIKGYATGAVKAPIFGAWRATKFGVREGAAGIYRGTRMKENIDLAKENLQASWLGRTFKPTKTQIEERDTKARIRVLKSTGLESDRAKAEQLQNALAASKQKTFEAEGIDTRIARQRLKVAKRGSADEEALAMIIASSGLMKSGEFKSYGISRDNKDALRVENRLRTAAYRAGDKTAFIGFSDNPAIPGNPKKDIDDMFRQHKNPGEQRAFLRNIKDWSQMDADGRMNHEYAPEFLSAINPDYFEKFDAEMQQNILDAFAYVQKNAPEKFNNLQLGNKYNELKGAGVKTGVEDSINSADRVAELERQQSLTAAGKEAVSYISGTLVKSDVDKGLEKIVRGEEKSWTASQVNAALRATHGAASAQNIGDIGVLLTELKAIKKELKTRAGARGAASTGQFKSDGTEMNSVEVLEGSRIWRNLSDAEDLAEDMSRSGKFDEKAKKAISQKVSIASRFIEDAAATVEPLPRERVRPLAKHPKSFYTTTQDYYVAEASARGDIDKITGINDEQKRVKQLKLSMNKLSSALRIIEKNAKRFSPDVSDSVDKIEKEIERLLQLGAGVSQANIDSLKALLDKTRDIIVPPS